MASLFSFLNRLLPFATPGTPLAQDLVHLAALCGLLYYGPQIQEWYQQRQNQTEEQEQDDSGPNETPDRVNTARPTDPEPPHVNRPGEHAPPEPQLGAAHPPAPPQVEDDEGEDGPPGPVEGQPGPANQPNIPAHRNVGAKKAKSLARRDQRRAYHEFQRAQGDAQRAREAEGAAEREAAQAAEKARRREAERKVEERKAREREGRREQERRAREEEMRRREGAVRLVRAQLEESGRSDLFKVAKMVGGEVDEEWVEWILSASGMLGTKGEVLTMVTGMGWCVSVGRQEMERAYALALEKDASDEDGVVSHKVLGAAIESVLKEGAAAVAM